MPNSGSSAPTRTSERLGRWAALLAVLITSRGLAAKPAPTHRPSPGTEQIFFYGDIGNPASERNPLLIRPATLLLSEDGSVALVDLRWHSWGGAVADAIGIWRASNCTPSCATGTLTSRPARLTLSRPGYLNGHRVYRCFEVRVPERPRARLWECLRHQGAFYLYSPETTHSLLPPPPQSATRLATPIVVKGLGPSHANAHNRSQAQINLPLLAP